jgi:ribosomal protein S25
MDVKRDTCPLRRSFVERPEGSDELTPLAALLRTTGQTGGKGGGLRIALLMSLIWVTARPPYSTSRVAPYWAELLGREDPDGVGARAIRDALHELADRGFVQLRSTGSRLEIILCNESQPQTADGEPIPYVPPYGVDPYIPVPRSFWSRGLAAELSGAGIAMYLCALALTRSDSPTFFISGSYFEERYGISRSSRKRGLAELTERGVLTVTVEETLDFNTLRKVRRNIYRLAKPYQQPPAWSPPDADANSKAPQPKTTAEGKA